jgi:hypothetical protein
VVSFAALRVIIDRMSATHQIILRDRPPTRLGQRLAIAFALAVVGAAIIFFLALFAAILSLTLAGFYRHAAGKPGSFSEMVDMRLAYRVIALPVAAAALPLVFFATLLRQSRSRRLPRT